MRPPIPIPEPVLYPLLSLVTLCLAPSLLAAIIQARLSWVRSVSYWTVYGGVLALVTLMGWVILGHSAVASSKQPALALAALLGVVTGVIAMRCDELLVRLLGRRTQVTRRGRVAGGDTVRTVLINPRRTAPADGQALWRQYGDQANWNALVITRRGPVLLTALAVLEELVARGVLVGVALLCDGVLRALLLVLGILVFALAHLQLGAVHVIAKLPLSAFAMATTLATGTVLAGVVTHVTFNACVCAAIRRRATTAPAG